MSKFSKSAPFRMSGIIELCPNGSIDHDDFGVTLRCNFNQVCPSVSCCKMLNQCELASSGMTQPPVTNSNCRRFNKLNYKNAVRLYAFG